MEVLFFLVILHDMKKETEEITPPDLYDYSPLNKVVEEIIANVCGYMNHVDTEKIRHDIWSAYIFARNAHEGYFRKS